MRLCPFPCDLPKYRDAFRDRCVSEKAVRGRQREIRAHRQVQIGGIIGGEVPTALTARTWTVYAIPPWRPEIVAELAAPPRACEFLAVDPAKAVTT